MNYKSPFGRLLLGNWALVICAIFYLAWWLFTFKPPQPKGSVIGRALLILAFVFGLTGIISEISALNQPGNIVREGISSIWLLVGGVLAYFVLLAVTGLILHRQVTSELLIITMWAVLELCAVNAWYQAGVLGSTIQIVFVAIIIIASLVSLVCYLLYYRLPYVQGYIDGSIPLIFTALVMTAINLTVMLKG